MIKSLAFFPSQSAKNSPPVLQAMTSAAQNHGIEIQMDSLEADAALIWSVLWHGRMAKNKSIYEIYMSTQRPVIIADIGALMRGITWKIALNNINGEGYYGHTVDLDGDRPKKLGIVQQPRRKSKRGVVLAAQHSKSLQVQCVDHVGWLLEQALVLRKNYDGPLILRPHPRCAMDMEPFRDTGVVLQPPRRLAGTYDSFDLDVAYDAVVNYNSGPGVLAALMGTKAVVHHSSLAAPVGVSGSDLHSPRDLDRDRWLTEISHTEYFLEEIAQGMWLQRLGLI